MASNGPSRMELARFQNESNKTLAQGVCILLPICMFILMKMSEPKESRWQNAGSDTAYLGSFVVVTYLAIDMVGDGVFAVESGYLDKLDEADMNKNGIIIQMTIGCVLAVVSFYLFCTRFGMCRERMEYAGSYAKSFMSFGRKRGRKKKC